MKDVIRHAAEFVRTLRKHKYEKTQSGLFFPRQKLFIGGSYGVAVNDEEMEFTHNLVVNEGLNDLLSVYLASGAQTTGGWYLAPFAGNITPASTLTAATFTSTTTEFTNYTPATRQLWAPSGVTNQTVGNATPAAFTIGTGGGTIYGAGLLSASGQNSTSGKCFSASRFSSSRVLAAADVLNISYTIQSTSS